MLIQSVGLLYWSKFSSTKMHRVFVCVGLPICFTVSSMQRDNYLKKGKAKKKLSVLCSWCKHVTQCAHLIRIMEISCLACFPLFAVMSPGDSTEHACRLNVWMKTSKLRASIRASRMPCITEFTHWNDDRTCRKERLKRQGEWLVCQLVTQTPWQTFNKIQRTITIISPPRTSHKLDQNLECPHVKNSNKTNRRS